jgi:xanthine dehydrogenase YagT iron-sulfur-binding subunit
MNKQDSYTRPSEQCTFEVIRHTMIETGTTALLLTALRRAVFAAGAIDDDDRPSLDKIEETGLSVRA